MKKLALVILGLFQGCVTESQESVPARLQYTGKQFISRYLVLDERGISINEADTMGVTAKDSYWYSEFAKLETGPDSCHVLIRETWWDYDYGTEDTATVAGRREGNRCVAFAGARYSRLEIEVGPQATVAKIRYLEIPYDSVDEDFGYGARTTNSMVIGLKDSETPAEVKDKLDSALEAKGLIVPYYNPSLNPGFSDPGMRVWPMRMYESETRLEFRRPQIQD